MSRAVLTHKLEACGHSRCGCVYGADCCTRCPLPVCVYDAPSLKYAARNQSIRSLRAQGLSARQIAERYGLARETIHRVLR